MKDAENLLYIRNQLDKIWSTIETQLNKKGITISSEKTLVFKFAWLLNSHDNLSIENIDFEKDIFDEAFLDGKFLDLYFEVLIAGIRYRIGVEFKFPNRKINGSGSTQIRQKIINDLKKLDSLIQNNKIDMGIFLCATNENYFLLNKKRAEGHFATYNGKTYSVNENYPCNKKYSHNLTLSNDIHFNWRNSNLIKVDYFSFLEPIHIICGKSSIDSSNRN